MEPSIWRLRQGSKEILHRCFRAFPGARAGSDYIGKAPRAHPVRPRHSCNGTTLCASPPSNDHSAYASLSPTRLVNTSRVWLTGSLSLTRILKNNGTNAKADRSTSFAYRQIRQHVQLSHRNQKPSQHRIFVPTSAIVPKNHYDRA